MVFFVCYACFVFVFCSFVFFCVEQIEQSIFSTGDTDGLETYDLDYFTKHVMVSALFKTNGDSLTISEVAIILITIECGVFVMILAFAESPENRSYMVWPVV